MTLSLTPINEAWTMPKEKKNNKKKEPKYQNSYCNPATQSKILNELGLLNEENIHQEPEIEMHKKETFDNSLNIRVTNHQLMNMLKPYSNDYIEMIILKCLTEPSANNSISSDVIDTIETMYMMVSILLVLVLLDIMLKFQKH